MPTAFMMPLHSIALTTFAGPLAQYMLALSSQMYTFWGHFGATFFNVYSPFLGKNLSSFVVRLPCPSLAMSDAHLPPFPSFSRSDFLDSKPGLPSDYQVLLNAQADKHRTTRYNIDR
jgi:hypothetical protein